MYPLSLFSVLCATAALAPTQAAAGSLHVPLTHSVRSQKRDLAYYQKQAEHLRGKYNFPNAKEDKRSIAGVGITNQVRCHDRWRDAVEADLVRRMATRRTLVL